MAASVPTVHEPNALERWHQLRHALGQSTSSGLGAPKLAASFAAPAPDEAFGARVDERPHDHVIDALLPSTSTGVGRARLTNSGDPPTDLKART
jgi:hypothetical protein